MNGFTPGPEPSVRLVSTADAVYFPRFFVSDLRQHELRVVARDLQTFWTSPMTVDDEHVQIAAMLGFWRPVLPLPFTVEAVLPTPRAALSRAWSYPW